MCKIYLKLVWIILFAVMVFSVSSAIAAEAGFKPIFDGRTLDGFKAAEMSYWSVEDGAITGRSTEQNPVKSNQFLVWQLIDRAGQYAGALYDERGRGMLATRGQKTVIGSGGKMDKSPLGDADALMNIIKKDDWNEYHIIARGNQIILKVNGQVMTKLSAKCPAFWRCSCTPAHP